jgi:hypothetical protein
VPPPSAATAPGAGSAPRQYFGSELTRRWCAREGLSLVVRSSTFAHGGFRVSHGGRLLTVCSARDSVRALTLAGAASGVAGSWPQVSGAPAVEPAGGVGNASALLLIAADDEGCLRVRAKVLACALPSAEAPGTQ